jgi:hypothetical protein
LRPRLYREKLDMGLTYYMHHRKELHITEMFHLNEKWSLEAKDLNILAERTSITVSHNFALSVYANCSTLKDFLKKEE